MMQSDIKLVVVSSADWTKMSTATSNSPHTVHRSGYITVQALD